MTKSRTCDALIIGGGSAGLRTAIEAHDAGAQALYNKQK
jgi:succinate dehydrogenase/fumarate reductase flavoprotein subunit